MDEVLAAAPAGPRHLTDERLPRAIARLAVPAVLSMMVESVHHLIDAFWIGRLGTGHLAALSSASFLMWMLYAFMKTAGIGIASVVARRTGERDMAGAAEAAGHGMLFSLLLAGLVMAPVWWLRRPIAELIGAGPEVTGLTLDYFSLFVAGLPVIYVFNAADSIFRGSGDTLTPMKLFALSVVVNACLDPLLIFGWGPVPALGIAGAAYATLVSFALYLVAAVVVLRRRGLLPAGRAAWSGRPALFVRIARIGGPVAVSSLVFSLVYLVIARLSARFGPEPLAAVGLGHRIESVAFFICFGFHIAAATLTGQHLGAGRPDRAARAAWATLAFGMLAGLPALAAYALAPAPLARLFSPDPVVVSQTASYLRVIGLLGLFQFSEFILMGAFSGAGDSVPPMLINIPLSIARIPAAWLLAVTLGLGPAGIWWAIGLSTMLKGAFMALWFSLNRWQAVRV